MRAGADEHEQDEPSYPVGVPNILKLGFIPIGVACARQMDHSEEAIRAVCERLDRPAHLVDAEGYEREITAGPSIPRTARSPGSSIGVRSGGPATSTSNSG